MLLRAYLSCIVPKSCSDDKLHAVLWAAFGQTRELENIYVWYPLNMDAFDMAYRVTYHRIKGQRTLYPFYSRHYQ